MRDKIQVYGLQRSGTNFLEWTLKNNFYIDYNSTKVGISNVIGDGRYKGYQSLKHCLPNLHNGKALIIKRDFEDWDASVKKQFPECNYSRETYDFYYNTPYRENWNEKEFLLVNHKWAVLNYGELLKSIS